MKSDWRTTLAGAIAAICVAAKPAVDPKYHQMLDASSQAALALGLVLARDAGGK